MSKITKAFGLAACLLAVPATLAVVTLTADNAPRLAFSGGVMHAVGWIAVFALLLMDVVAVQIALPGPPSAALGDLFVRIMNSSTVIALNILATFHLVGGIVLGIAIWKTPGFPRWAALIWIVGGPVHFLSNINGMLLVDELTWIALIAANIPVIQLLGQNSN